MTLYITGAGVSSDRIPTFRGQDGYWTIGSNNYTPQEMATKYMYENNPEQFLKWYFERFIKYKDVEPNAVHRFLADKDLITQNVDCLDDKAGNKNYIPIHGRIDKVTKFDKDGIYDAPWDEVKEDGSNLLEVFKINGKPERGVSLKPHILLFDEFYTEQYRISEANRRISEADKVVFLGTSFSVNFPLSALERAYNWLVPIEIVDPDPDMDLAKAFNAKVHKMTAEEYIDQLKNKKFS